MTPFSPAGAVTNVSLRQLEHNLASNFKQAVKEKTAEKKGKKNFKTRAPAITYLKTTTTAGLYSLI